MTSGEKIGFPTRGELLGWLFAIAALVFSVSSSLVFTRNPLNSAAIYFDLFALVASFFALLGGYVGLTSFDSTAEKFIKLRTISSILLVGMGLWHGLRACGFLGADLPTLLVQGGAPIMAPTPTPATAFFDNVRDVVGFPTPTPTAIPPTPAPGNGGLSGIAEWNDQPLANKNLLLCESYFIDCGGESYTTTSNADGAFLFADVIPDKYALLGLSESGQVDMVTFGDSIFAFFVDFEVPIAETQNIGNVDFVRTDLTPIYPADDAEIDPDGSIIVLEWEPFPEATSYEISLTSSNGDIISYEVETTEAKSSAELQDQNCTYSWRVEAFNASGTQIGRMGLRSSFETTGSAVSCIIDLLSPADYAEVSAENVTLDWQPHPWAAYYEILMWDDLDPDQENVLSFTEVAESTYTFTESIGVSTFVWTIYAYDTTGTLVGESDIYRFDTTNSGTRGTNDK